MKRKPEISQDAGNKCSFLKAENMVFKSENNK